MASFVSHIDRLRRVQMQIDDCRADIAFRKLVNESYGALEDKLETLIARHDRYHADTVAVASKPPPPDQSRRLAEKQQRRDQRDEKLRAEIAEWKEKRSAMIREGKKGRRLERVNRTIDRLNARLNDPSIVLTGNE